MFKKLNGMLRGFILIFGITVEIFRFIDKINEKNNEAGDGYSQKEYDDIW